MTDPTAGLSDTDPAERAAAVAAVGAQRRASPEVLTALAALVESDTDARVRAVALGSLARLAPHRTAARSWRVAARDDEAAVRRRAAEVAPSLGTAVPPTALLALLHDTDAFVAEAAAFALGERARSTARVVSALCDAARDHRDPLVRESAVAALGAIGDPAALPTVLAACDDKPAIRRRAVLALAAFEGDDVEARLRAALDDPDWQVRQAAEDLLA